MIVVHGWWVGGDRPTGRLALWAEDSAAPPEPPRRPGRRPTVRDHPFAIVGEELVTLLGLGFGIPTPLEVGSAVLTLPTRGRGPVASPELPLTAAAPADDPTDSAADTADAPTSAGLWRVPTVLLDPDAALVLLTSPACRGPAHPNPATTPASQTRVAAATAGRSAFRLSGRFRGSR